MTIPRSISSTIKWIWKNKGKIREAEYQIKIPFYSAEKSPKIVTTDCIIKSTATKIKCEIDNHQ